MPFKIVRLLDLFVILGLTFLLEASHAFPIRAVMHKATHSRTIEWNALYKPMIPKREITRGFVSKPTTLQATIDVNTEGNLLLDKDTWEAYKSVVIEVMKSPRVLKKENPDDIQEAKAFLLSREIVLSAPSIEDEDFRVKIREQKELFNQTHNLSQSQYEFSMRCLVYMGDHCAKRQSARPIAVAWQKMKESGMIPRENCISTYMYVLSMEDVCSEDVVEVANFHDLFFPPNEKTITLRIKSLIGKKDIAKAEEILASLPVSFLQVSFRELSFLRSSDIC
jgi:hypothetical protein